MNNFFIGIFHGELECLLAANECNDTLLLLVEPKKTLLPPKLEKSTRTRFPSSKSSLPSTTRLDLWSIGMVAAAASARPLVESDLKNVGKYLSSNY